MEISGPLLPRMVHGYANVVQEGKNGRADACAGSKGLLVAEKVGCAYRLCVRCDSHIRTLQFLTSPLLLVVGNACFLLHTASTIVSTVNCWYFSHLFFLVQSSIDAGPRCSAVYCAYDGDALHAPVQHGRAVGQGHVLAAADEPARDDTQPGFRKHGVYETRQGLPTPVPQVTWICCHGACTRRRWLRLMTTS